MSSIGISLETKIAVAPSYGASYEVINKPCELELEFTARIGGL
jgi:hypothetical protein